MVGRYVLEFSLIPFCYWFHVYAIVDIPSSTPLLDNVKTIFFRSLYSGLSNTRT